MTEDLRNYLQENFYLIDKDDPNVGDATEGVPNVRDTTEGVPNFGDTTGEC
jgi:hypothetical protein